MCRWLLRTASAAVAAVASGRLVWQCARPGLHTLSGLLASSPRAAPPTLVDVVASSVAVIAVGACGALLATATVAVGSHLVVPQHAERIAATGWAGPRWWRTLVLTGCGIGLAAQAAAAEPAAPDQPPCASTCGPVLDGLPYPDLPTVAPARPQQPRPPLPAGSGRGRPAYVTVRPGDCLWTIATELAPSRPTEAAIAAFVDRLYAVNRVAIGDDPDLIFPGTALRVPGGHQ